MQTYEKYASDTQQMVLLWMGQFSCGGLLALVKYKLRICTGSNYPIMKLNVKKTKFELSSCLKM